MKSVITIMGIVNLTPDSFYSASKNIGPEGTLDPEALRLRVGKMIEEGAGIIDVGACSTRPGSVPASEDEEWRRLEPGLRLIREAFPDIPISVDTFRPGIVSRAYDAVGPVIVNDVSGAADPSMIPLAAGLGLTYIATHCSPDGEKDVMERVFSFFRDFAEKACASGLEDWILDPGFGFGKTLEENYVLLSGLSRLQDLGRPVLVGVSRKSMATRLLGITPDEALAPTQVLHLAALEGGASILRVHDVKEAAHTVKIRNALHGTKFDVL